MMHVNPLATRAAQIVLLILFQTTAWLAPTFAHAAKCQEGPWYCIEALNEGLSEPKRAVDRNTPRAAIESFIHAAAREDWDAAAHILNLSDIPTDRQAENGPILAQELFTVIQRKAVIDWNALLDRPDALDGTASSDAAMAGKPRKSLLLWTLSLENYPASIRLNRVASLDQAPVWVFSTQTVDNIPALYDRHGPSAFEEMLPDELRESSAFGFMLWELLAVPMIFLLVLVIGRLIWKLLDRVAHNADRPVFMRIAKVARGPVTTGVSTGLVLIISTQFLVFSGQISTILEPVAWLGLMAATVWLAINTVEVILDQLLQFNSMELREKATVEDRALATRLAAARRILVILISLIGGGVFLSQTNIFQNFGLTLLGTAGALTLVLGFAARQVLGNILASLQIALNQSARIGDRIVYNGYLCHVERINFTYVQLRDWDGTRLVVPVEEFASTPFENWSLKEPEMLRIIKLKCAHDADVDALRSAFSEIISELDSDYLGDIELAKVRVADQDVFGKEIWFALPCADPNSSWDVACQAREKLIARGNEIARGSSGAVFPDVTPAEAA